MIFVLLTDHTSTSQSAGIDSTRVVLLVKVRGSGANTTTQLTAATVAEKYRYACPEPGRRVPFGAVAAQTGSGSDYLFTGQERDEETGLHNFRARMMSGTDELGRFFAIPKGTWDPQVQFHSPYVYAANNPVSLTDPDGEWVHIAVGAAIGGTVNWLANGARFDEQGFKYFAVGAVAGGLAAGVGLDISNYRSTWLCRLRVRGY